ncbi:MAG: helix-turn-helix transcriptional regulator [Flavonifractor plautii]|nr:helix-turn-helix transcriptional regulator [Flavonifractor plautii]
MDYTQRLRDLRADHDMSQAAIAAAIGIDQKQYSRYETGINELPLRYLVKLCQVYQVSADYLLCGHTKKGRNTPPLFWVQYLN